MICLANAPEFHATVDAAIERCSAGAEIDRAFGPIRPRWYGFWLPGTLDREQIRLLLAVLEGADEAAFRAAPGLDEFLAALRVSLEVPLPLYTRLIPSGCRRQFDWKLDSHCKACRCAAAARRPLLPHLRAARRRLCRPHCARYSVNDPTIRSPGRSAPSAFANLWRRARRRRPARAKRPTNATWHPFSITSSRPNERRSPQPRPFGPSANFARLWPMRPASPLLRAAG